MRRRLLAAPVKTANGTNPMLFTRAKIMRAIAEHYCEKKLTRVDRIIRWLPKLTPEQIDELQRTIDENRESRVTSTSSPAPSQAIGAQKPVDNGSPLGRTSVPGPAWNNRKEAPHAVY